MREVSTVLGDNIEAALLERYFSRLVNRFFKILPLREACEATLSAYLRSLQAELLGCKGFVPTLATDADFMVLLAILQFFVEHPESEIADVRREVFRAIRICKKLREIYT